jgi:NADH-quinone oxidoreductase subunit J
MSADTLAYILYAVFVLGGLGIYFALPQERRWPRGLPWVLGLAGLAGFLVVLGLQFAPGGGGFYWVLFAAISVFAAARVVTHRRPVYSAIYFVLSVLAVAGLLLLLSAEFVAVALIIIYAGAIIVTYAFVMMLVQHAGRPVYDNRSRAPLGAVLAGFLLTATLSSAVADGIATLPKETPFDAKFVVTPPAEKGPVPVGNTAAVGATLLSRYMVPLEFAGVLLFIAMVGAVAVARKHVPATEPDVTAPPTERPPGEAGRQAKPFLPELKKV